eukprot:INCI15211.1.p1 GENE.INCI15211.1~~INCI15211.1.p1  ORF type:complete len:228 (+),score=44.34 INCI15211.1:137-820(+)
MPSKTKAGAHPVVPVRVAATADVVVPPAKRTRAGAVAAIASPSVARTAAPAVPVVGAAKKTRYNPNAGKVCSRKFVGCGADPGVYDPVTRLQKGRKQHSAACCRAWKASGAISLVGADAHRRRRGQGFTGRASGEKAQQGAQRAKRRAEARAAQLARTAAIIEKLVDEMFDERMNEEDDDDDDVDDGDVDEVVASQNGGGPPAIPVVTATRPVTATVSAITAVPIPQ